MRAAALQLLGEVHVVLERVAVPGGVEYVARVADRGLQQLARLEDGLHGRLHARYPVERVEHAENVYARLGALVNEGADQVVRVAGVADEV